jgi:PRC-barrel domain protein
LFRSFREMESDAVDASDGPIGHLSDLYFDDQAWLVRYLVVETGPWLSRRKVLISPTSIRRAPGIQRSFPVALTRLQVRDSPKMDTRRPVSRQHETQYLGYYDYLRCQEDVPIWAMGQCPYAIGPRFTGHGMVHTDGQGLEEFSARAERSLRSNEDRHLRSCKEVIGYRLHASDGDAGRVGGYLVDDVTWTIRHIVVNASAWWFGHQILIAPQWITDVGWAAKHVSVDRTRAAIRQAPLGIDLGVDPRRGVR